MAVGNNNMECRQFQKSRNGLFLITMKACCYIFCGTRDDYPTGDVDGPLLEAAQRPRYPSKNRFYCGQRALSGPDRFLFWLSAILTVLPVIAFLLFSGPWMWSWFSPAIPICVAWLYCTCLALHLATSYSDPGILPRRLAVENEANTFRAPPMTKTVMVRGVRMQEKWCQTCSIYRPPRAVHCGVCDNCVDRFDHHCPWTGNCVGRRNYRLFLWMVGTYVVMDLFVAFLLVAKIIVLSLNSPNVGPKAFWEAVTIDPSSPIIILLAIAFAVFQGSLLVYHLKLSMLDETTNENRKRVYRGKRNPHSEGWARNLLGRFCGPSRLRYIKFHVDERESSADLQPHVFDDDVSMLSVPLQKSQKPRTFRAEFIEV